MVRDAAVCSRSSQFHDSSFPQTLAFARVFVLALSTFLALSATAFAQKFATGGPAKVRAMQLVTPAAGWALADQHLMWTSDAGQNWNDITPNSDLPQSIDGVFFLNETAGWVVLSGIDPSGLANSLQLAATIDGGASWQFHALTDVAAQVEDSYTGMVSLSFADSAHGWMMIRLASSSNFSLGMLFATIDGGATWAESPAPPIGNAIRFVTVQDGWLAGGPGGDEIYATHDGGLTWQVPPIPLPSGAGPDLRPQYQLPVFTSAVDGTLTVNFVGAKTTSAAAYSTHDGGYSWDAVDANAGLPIGQKLAASIAAATAGAASMRAAVTPGTAEVTTAPAVQQVDFKNDVQGWVLVSSSQCAGFKTDCTESSQLLATTDGGATVADITPSVAETTFGMQALEAAGIIRQSTGQTEGFDACTPTTIAQMQDWWLNSPFTSVNIYLGGASLSSCARPLHDANWVTQSAGMGWGIIPTWVGPQAPLTGSTTAYKCSTCTTCRNTISPDPTVSATQGTAQADLAMAATAAVGLDNTIIYYDMEKYNQNANVPTCRAAVQAFLNAWTQELHANGYKSGIYTSDANFRDDLTVDNPGVGPANVADAIWIARWNLRDTIFGYMYLADTYWTDHQRIHQWKTGTWKYGNTTLNVDLDAVDGILALPGTLILTAAVSPDSVGTITSEPAGISCGTTCQAGMPTNGTVTLTATPVDPAKWVLTGWTGCASVADNTCTVTMNVARNVTAIFAIVTTTSVSAAPNTYGDPATVTVTVSAIDNTPSGDVTLSVDGIPQGAQALNNGSATFTIAAGLDAGPHALEATLAAQNGFAASSGAGTLTVATRPVTVTAEAQTKVYGQTDPALTYKITAGSLALSDTFSGALARDPGENVGTYAINQGTLALNSNYQLTYVPAILTITPAPLTITADNKTMILGGAMPALTASYSGFVNGDTAASLSTQPTLTTVPATSAVGSYDINVGGAVDPNYVITYKSGKLNITYNICYLYDQTKAVQLSATVPIRLQLCNVNGINVSSPAVGLHGNQLTLTGGATGLVEDSGNANPDDNFRYDGLGYIFNLSTKALSPGTWVLSFTATGDPVTHSAAFGVR